MFMKGKHGRGTLQYKERRLFSFIVFSCVCNMFAISSATLKADCAANITVCNKALNIECNAAKKCACTAGFAVKTDACVAILGGDCKNATVASTCTVKNSECKELKCACKAGYEAKSGLCVENAAAKTRVTVTVILATMIVSTLQKLF